MIIKSRNAIIKYAYKNLLKPILFKFDPESIHNLFIKTGIFLGNCYALKIFTGLMFNYSNKILKQNILGIEFRNPVGLSAGFDKNAELTKIIPKVGFGFEEVGSITAKYCSGNSGVRLKRLPEEKSLWINLGLNNAGVDKITARLKNEKFKMPILISVAKTNCRETAEPSAAVEDYIYSIKKSQSLASFIVINISCPNAYGGQPFTNPELFEILMKEIHKLEIKKPLFIKMSPDLNDNVLDRIIKISEKYKISGFVCSNLTKKHKFKNGGLSGKILEEKSNNLISYVYKKTKGKKIIIGVGGIFSAEDAYKKIKAGASLVELITGMIYEGPALISEINLGIVSLLKKEGYKNISEAIGKGSN